MADNILEPIPANKIYKESSVQVATFFGGPLVAGYLISENFKSLGDRQKIRPTWVYTILVSILIFGIVLFVPGLEKVPSYIIPIAYGGIAGYLVRRMQGEKIKTHTSNGGQIYSIWRALLVSVIGLIITVGILLLFASFSDIARLLR